jgi:hypothetical protein
MFISRISGEEDATKATNLPARVLQILLVNQHKYSETV